MDHETLRVFFMGCSIINGVILTFYALILLVAGEWMRRLHARWFPVSRETYYAANYLIIGIYKILFLVFNLVPFIILSLRSAS